MTKNMIKTDVIQLISELFKNKCFAYDVIEDVDLVDDMGMDSVFFISIIIELENKFGIVFPDDVLIMDNFKKINEIVDLIIICLKNSIKENGDIID